MTAAPPSTALLTDRYELTMLQAALRDGTAHRHCVFEVFTRRLPAGRRYGVLAGTGRVLEAVAAFRFGDAELSLLKQVAANIAFSLQYLRSRQDIEYLECSIGTIDDPIPVSSRGV